MNARGSLPSLTARSPLRGAPCGVGPVCLGAVGAPATIAAAFEAGINFFAVGVDLHWPAYEATRRGLADLVRDRPGARDTIVVMAVAYATNPRFCRAPLGELLAAEPALGRVDVAAMGAAGDADFLARWEAHAKDRDARAHGVTALGALLEGSACARVAIAHALVDVAFVAERPSLHASRAARLAPVDDAAIPVFAAGATLDAPGDARLDALGVAADKWRPRAGDYARYALGSAPFRGVFWEARDERAIRDLDDALRAGPLGDDERAYLEDLADLHLGLAALA